MYVKLIGNGYLKKSLRTIADTIRQEKLVISLFKTQPYIRRYILLSKILLLLETSNWIYLILLTAMYTVCTKSKKIKLNLFFEYRYFKNSIVDINCLIIYLKKNRHKGFILTKPLLQFISDFYKSIINFHFLKN